MLLTILANNVQIAPVVPPIPPPPDGGIGGGGGSHHRYRHEEKEEEKRREIQERSNRFIIEFLKTATDIINNQ